MLRILLPLYVFLSILHIYSSNLVCYGPWRLFDGDNYLEFTENYGNNKRGISLMGLPGAAEAVFGTEDISACSVQT